MNQPEPVLICTRCRYALKPSTEGIARHLRQRHDVPARHRIGLEAVVLALQLPDPNRVPPRPDGGPPHPHLLVQRGVACERCDYRSTSRELMRRHLSRRHGQTGGRKHWRGDGIRDNVGLQSWSQNGARGYWIVAIAAEDAIAVPDAGVDAPVTTSPRRRQRVAALHREERQRLAQVEQTRSATQTGPDDLDLTSNWMRRTGWTTTLAGADRRLLSLLDQDPAGRGHRLALGRYGARAVYSRAADERNLGAIVQAVDRFFDRCEDTARHTDNSIRCWLRSQIPGRPCKYPFELPGRDSTGVRYRRWWKRMLLALFRLSRLDDAAREEFLRVRLSDRQRAAVASVWAVADQHVSAGEPDDLDDESDDLDDELDDRDDEPDDRDDEPDDRDEDELDDSDFEDEPDDPDFEGELDDPDFEDELDDPDFEDEPDDPDFEDELGDLDYEDEPDDLDSSEDGQEDIGPSLQRMDHDDGRAMGGSTTGG